MIFFLVLEKLQRLKPPSIAVYCFAVLTDQDKPMRLKMKGTRKKALNPTVQ